MRWLVILLLFCNLLFLGWQMQRQARVEVRNAAAAQQVPANAARLSLISELAEAPPLRLEQPPPAAAPAAADGLVAQLPEFGMAPALAADAEASCFSYGPLPDERQAVWLGDWFRSRRAEVQSRSVEDGERQLFWIYLAPQQSLDSALAVVKDLEQRGVRDYRVIRSGDMSNAVSLGLFSSQAAVNARLAELKDKGYQPVVVPYTSGQRFWWLDVRVPALPELLKEMFEGYPARYSSVPVKCSEIAMSGGSP